MINAHAYLNKSTQELEGLTTRALMTLRDSTYSGMNRCGCPSHCGDEVLTQAERDENYIIGGLRNRVKAILATREHVPNKKEAKAIRQAAAKAGR
jgi:hypothetical protein